MNTIHNQSNHAYVRNPEAYRYELHRHYAGEIILSDFHTGHPSGNTARKIVQAETFDDICRINHQLRQGREDYI